MKVAAILSTLSAIAVNSVPHRNVYRQSAPDPDQVRIVGYTYGGSGCPSGSLGAALSEDSTTVTLIYDEYIASIGPSISISESRKNCQLNLNLLYPGGFQYSVFSADYRGHVYLDPGVNGVQKSIYYFSGQQAQSNTATTWQGPYDGDYQLNDVANSTSTIWSPCGDNAMLNINSAISLTRTNSSGSGYLTDDSLDIKFTQILHVRWQTCNETSPFAA